MNHHLNYSVEEIFEKYDTDGSGTISFDEFRNMLPEFGICISIPKMLEYFRLCDTDGSGQIGLEELKFALFTCDSDGNPVGFNPTEFLSPKDCFRMFDKDGSGKLDEDEFHFLLEYLGITIDERTEENMFRKYDGDKSGYIEYPEFKKVWLRIGNTRKELSDRGVRIPSLVTKHQLIKMLEKILDEEEEKENLAIAEAERSKKQKEVLGIKNVYVSKAQLQARTELAHALDAAGQVYVFGAGTLNQFCKESKTNFDTTYFKQEGFNLLRSLWSSRVAPTTFIENPVDKKLHVQEKQRKSLVMDLYDTNDRKSSLFQGLNIQENTVGLWGRCPKEIAVGESSIFALCENGSIYAWGGNNHWWHQLEADSHWQTRSRDLTFRSAALLNSDDQDKMSYCKKDNNESTLATNDGIVSMKIILQYYDEWKPVNDCYNLNEYAKRVYAKNVNVQQLLFSLKVRGKVCNGLTKADLSRILYEDITLERQVLGEADHLHIRELERNIVKFKVQKREKMAEQLQLRVLDIWRPLIKLQEEREENSRESKKSKKNERMTIEKNHETWLQYLQQCNTQHKLKSPLIRVSGVTPRGGRLHTPRLHSKCVSIASGANHVGVIHENGSLFMWGLSIAGRLGIDVVEDEKRIGEIFKPTRVKSFGQKHVSIVSCGHSHTAAVCDGSLYVWGSSSNGKLGLGEFTSFQETYCSTPVKLDVPTCKIIVKVSCGANHSACIGSGGELFVWGCGSGGKLGLGQKRMFDHYSPILVDSLLHENFSDVSCGVYQTLAITSIKEETSGLDRMKEVTLSGGKLFVAGPANLLGSAFHRFGQYQWFRKDYQKHNHLNKCIIKISAGFNHQAVVTMDGELYTWGNNANGCCGHNANETFIPIPSLVKCIYERPNDLALNKPYNRNDTYNNQSYFEIDLGALATIKKIILWNNERKQTDLSIVKDNFTHHLFPCWVMVSQYKYPETIEKGSLRRAWKMSCSKKHFTDDKRKSIWSLHRSCVGRYVQLQVDGLNLLGFSKVEVFGKYGLDKSVGKVSCVTAGKQVTGIVIGATKDPNGLDIAYKRAVAADCYNSKILRQLDAYSDLYDRIPKTNSLDINCVDCILCVGGRLCPLCELKQKYRDKLSSSFQGMDDIFLDDIINVVMDTSS